MSPRVAAPGFFCEVSSIADVVLRAEADAGYQEMFEEIDQSIRDRSAKIRDRIERRKAKLQDLAARKASGAPVPDTVVTTEEIRDEAKDILDLSFMHLFSGDSERALKLLLKAKDLSDRAKINSPDDAGERR